MSHSPISVLQKLRIPTNSYIAAAQAAGSFRSECDVTKYNQLISQIVGDTVIFDEFPMAQMTFGYLVQELVRSHVAQTFTDIGPIKELAVEKAKKIVAEQPWHWPVDSGSKVDRLEEIRRFVSTFKEDTAKELLIEKIVEGFEVTRATAQSYIRQLEKGDDAPEAVKVQAAEPKVKINKGVEAAKLVQEHFDGTNKAALIAMISEQLSTTRGGAQTFFYAAVKNLDLSVKKQNPVQQSSTQERLKGILADDPTIDKNGFLVKAEELGIKRSTAQTYYYSLTSNMGVERKGTGTRGRKKVGEFSRAEQVQQFMAQFPELQKNEMIEKLSQHFNVSKLSAQSYYYAAKKADK